MCSFAAGMANVLEIGYSTPLIDVFDALDDEIKNDGISYPQDFGLFEPFLNLPAATRALYDRLWPELLG
jgi:hypothetical protein